MRTSLLTPFLFFIPCAVTSATAGPVTSVAQWQPGINYEVLSPPQPTAAGPGKVEVMEVFWLGCPHCYHLEPTLQGWLKNKPSYVNFVRVPVMWNPVTRAHAHLFLTLMALKRPELVSGAFDAIHLRHQMLVGPTEEDTLEVQQQFAQANGISPADYSTAYNSFSVHTNLTHAQELTDRYKVPEVPFIVVNGKYTTNVDKAGGQDKLIALINYLAAKEHRH
jgi:protein dithiol oxidoreductase (disulfide-forming)